MTSKTYPDSTSANYVYDLVGKIQQVTDPTGTYAFAYDNMGRLIGTTTQYAFLPGHNFQNSYSYDAASNRTSLTAPDGSTNTYNYDTLNRLATLTNSLTGQFGFGYDALSRRTQLTRPNGVNTNYNYDSVSHLLSVLHQAGSTTLDGASYGYDYAGNRTSKTNYLNGTTSNYGYDAIYELQQVTQGGGTTESYSYDAVGNRLSSLGMSPYSYNPSNELTSTSSGSYTYDANGNTLSDPSGKSYTWDFENRLTSGRGARHGDGRPSSTIPSADRIYKSSPNFTGIFVYDNDNLIETVNASGTVLARYTQGENLDEPLAELRSGRKQLLRSRRSGVDHFAEQFGGNGREHLRLRFLRQRHELHGHAQEPVPVCCAGVRSGNGTLREPRQILRRNCRQVHLSRSVRLQSRNECLQVREEQSSLVRRPVGTLRNKFQDKALVFGRDHNRHTSIRLGIDSPPETPTASSRSTTFGAIGAANTTQPFVPQPRI